jgi:hypothetical protein
VRSQAAPESAWILLINQPPWPELFRGFFRFRNTFENFTPKIPENNDERKKHMKTLTNIIYPAFAAFALAWLALARMRERLVTTPA